MTKIKKIAAGIVAAATMASISVVASAHDYNFDLNTSDHGDTAYSTVAYKDNDEDYAEIWCQDGNLTTETYAYLAVCNSSKSVISKEVRATSCNNDEYDAKYTSTIPGSKERLYLRSRTGYWGANVSGYWIP